MQISWVFVASVALGSALGGVMRFLISVTVSNAAGGGFPWGTLAVNTAGCFLIGLLAALPLPPWWRVFLIPGFCGGFTTFSAYSLESLTLLRERGSLIAALYAVASVVLCAGAAFVGQRVAAR